jgi:hypothetical protein
MPHKQKALRLTLTKNPGEPQHEDLFRQRLVNGKEKLTSTIPSWKLLADLLKRQARRVMQDVTTCQPDTIAAHVARLDDLRDIIRHCLLHELKETPEASMGDFPLNSTYTVADHLFAMDNTRKTHRCPAFVNWRDAELSEIHSKLDLIAGILSTPELQARLMEERSAA